MMNKFQQLAIGTLMAAAGTTALACGDGCQPPKTPTPTPTTPAQPVTATGTGGTAKSDAAAQAAAIAKLQAELKAQQEMNVNLRNQQQQSLASENNNALNANGGNVNFMQEATKIPKFTGQLGINLGNAQAQNAALTPALTDCQTVEQKATSNYFGLLAFADGGTVTSNQDCVKRKEGLAKEQADANRLHDANAQLVANPKTAGVGVMAFAKTHEEVQGGVDAQRAYAKACRAKNMEPSTDVADMLNETCIPAKSTETVTFAAPPVVTPPVAAAPKSKSTSTKSKGAASASFDGRQSVCFTTKTDGAWRPADIARAKKLGLCEPTK